MGVVFRGVEGGRRAESAEVGMGMFGLKGVT